MKSLKQELLNNSAKIGIWGSGYIGFTSAINFAINGIYTLCYDINQDVVKAINNGNINIANLEFWLGFPIKTLVKDGLIRATTRYQDLLSPEVRVHLIAVPTEKNGEPWSNPLVDVIKKICQKKVIRNRPNLIVIESTLIPNDVDNLILPIIKNKYSDFQRKFIIGVAPRRDWFHSPEMNLKNLKRVVGTTDSKSAKVLKDVLDIICDNLIVASNHRVAELVKSVENSLLHIPSVYAMQLSRAYPDIDIKEVLDLAATHWRIPHYFASIGTGGYCIPVSCKYVIKGATYPRHLTIPQEAIKKDEEQKKFMATLISKKTSGKIGILGITYKGDLKVHVLSPTLRIINYLRDEKREILVNDPYYSDRELFEIARIKCFRFPEDVGKFNVLVIGPNHRKYVQIPKNALFSYLHSGQIIFDNLGTWERYREEFKKHGILYFRIGNQNWTLENIAVSNKAQRRKIR